MSGIPFGQAVSNLAQFKSQHPKYEITCKASSSYRMKQGAIATVAFLALAGLLVGATVALWKQSLAGGIASGIVALPAFVVFANSAMNFSKEKGRFSASPTGIMKMKLAQPNANFDSLASEANGIVFEDDSRYDAYMRAEAAKAEKAGVVKQD